MTTTAEVQAVDALRHILVAKGYETVSIRTRDKRPVEFGWQRRADPFAPARPDALNTGIRCGRIIAADMDIDDEAAAEEVTSVLVSIAGQSPAVRTRENAPRSLHLYRAPDGVEMKKRIVTVPGGKVEFLASGQQFVAYGIHPTGVEFEWRSGGPDIVAADALPIINQEMIDAFSSRFDAGVKEPEKPDIGIPTSEQNQRFTTTTAGGAHSADDRGRAYAETALANAVADLRATPEGCRSDTLKKLAFKVGTMVGRGWLGMSEAQEALNGAVADWSNQPKTRSTIVRALKDGATQPHPDLEDREAPADEMLERGKAAAEALSGAVPAVEALPPLPPVEAAPDPADLDFPDADLASVPGLVGEFADWIYRTSPSPIRLFSTTAAILTVGALVGRQVYTGTRRTGTHLYAMMLTGTGGGKDWPLRAPGEALIALGRSRQTMSKVKSGGSLQDKLSNYASQLLRIDEIAGFFDSLQDKRSSQYQKEVADILCELWGISTGHYLRDTTMARMDVDPIVNPWCSLLGATTLQSFRPLMRSKELLNGFWNRFLFLPRYQRPELVDNPETNDEVPAGIISSMRALMTFGDVEGPHQVEASSRWGNPQSPPPFRVIEPTAEAAAIFADMSSRQNDLMRMVDEDPALAVWQRGAEMAKRVALIIACGRHARSMEACQITGADADFASRFVTWSKQSFLREVRENMAENQAQADYLMVAGIIRTARQVAAKDVKRRLRGQLKAWDLEQIIQQLIDAGHMTTTQPVRAGTRGRHPSEVYTWVSG